MEKDIEHRYNGFAEKAKENTNWALSQIIRFLPYQKERVEKEEITGATLRNFIKAIKLFCEMQYLELVLYYHILTDTNWLNLPCNSILNCLTNSLLECYGFREFC
jgi:hypothetical protein